jgi:hypothetical protein
MNKLLIFDNDETIGYFRPVFSIYALIYSMWFETNEYGTPKISWEKFYPIFVHFMSITYFKNCGALRPGIITILKLSLHLRKTGQVDHILMFTLASNDTGVVTFLSDCTESCLGEPLFDSIIDRTNTFFYEQNGFPKKKLSQIKSAFSSNYKNMIMFDDNTDNISEPFSKVKVVPYVYVPTKSKQIIFCSQLVRFISRFINNFDVESFKIRCDMNYNNDTLEMSDMRKREKSNKYLLMECHQMMLGTILNFGKNT